MSETAPTSSNNPESNIPENWELRDKDPAASLVDGARAFRESVHASGATSEQIGGMFNDDGSGVAGAPELMKLITRMREKGNSTLGSNEFAFTKHMQVEKNYHDAMASVDWQKFAAKGKEASGDNTIHNGAAYREGYNWVIADLEQKLLTATDLAEQDALEDKIELVTKLRDIETTSLAHKSGPDTLEAKYVGTLVERDDAPADKMDDYNAAMGGMKAELSDRDKQTNDVISALKVLSDDYPDEFSRAPVAGDAIDNIPELEYVDPAAPTNPDDTADPADATPAPAGPRAETAEETKLRIELENDEFNNLREQIAKQRTSAGKRFKDLFGLDDNPDRLALEQEYKEMSRYMAERDNPILRDPTAPADLKAAAAAKFVLTEQAQMRALYKEKLENTSVAKISKWIGKHRFLVIGGLTILAPLTMGTSLTMGAALAGGLLAGSKVDSMMRGRGIGDKSGVSMKELKNRIQASGGDFDAGHDFAKADFEEEAKKEMRNRTIAVGGAAAAATIFSSVNMGGFFNGLDHPMQYVKGASILAILFGLAKPEKEKAKTKH